MSVNLKLSDGSLIKCKECGCESFVPAYTIYKFSKLLTGEAKDTVEPIQTFACLKCGTIPEEFLPKDSNGLIS